MYMNLKGGSSKGITFSYVGEVVNNIILMDKYEIEFINETEVVEDV